MKKKLLLGLLCVSAIIGLSACKAKEYTVTVQPNNGTTVDSFVVTENGTITAPANPTKEGYTFDGWYLDANFSTKVDFSTFKVTEDVALYAKWVINTYTVTFNSNGGSEVANATVNKILLLHYLLLQLKKVIHSLDGILMKLVQINILTVRLLQILLYMLSGLKTLKYM